MTLIVLILNPGCNKAKKLPQIGQREEVHKFFKFYLENIFFLFPGIS
jgi:hypothetical protein